MSTPRPTPPTGGAMVAHAPRVRRVREQARDVLAVMAFSALSSTLLAGVLLLVVSIGR